MRLFTALDISDDARASLEELVRLLAPAAPFQWSAPGNLHITAKFIGRWPKENYETLRLGLAAMPTPGPIEIAIRGLGWYPNPHSPRILFAGVAAGPGLALLHAAIDAACAAIGVPAELKPFHPHLTLARVKTPDGLQAVRREIAQLAAAEFGQFTARAFHLYESVTRPGGSEYHKLEEFPLQ